LTREGTPDVDTYICIRCTISVDLEEDLPELLSEWPVLGTEVVAVSDDGVRATVYLSASEGERAREVRHALQGRGALDIEEGTLSADDWLAEYRTQVQPLAVGGRWWIDPHPERPTAAPADRLRLVIEPRMAFGTGSHESTQAILLALEEMEVSHRRVLDVGTGSGILALAAERVGATWVVGLDIDEVAIRVAAETALQQDWESAVTFVLGSTRCIGKVEFDIVLCNMMTTNLLPLVDELKRLAGSDGALVCSGMLASEVGEVTDSLRASGLRVISNRRYGDWACMTASAAGRV
jgi:ribosomal protein L11 methyltransferase